MKDDNKTKRQLINELVELRQQIYRLEKLEIQRKQAEKSLERLYHQNELILKAAGEGIFGLDIHGKHRLLVLILFKSAVKQFIRLLRFFLINDCTTYFKRMK